jgi:cytochrome P450
MVVQYDPLLPEVQADPYPVYKRLREEDPVHWSEALDAWVLTRYDDVVAVLKDLQFSAERRGARNRFVQQAETAAGEYGPTARANTMLTSDPPEHTRLRLLVSKAFLPRAVERLRPHVQNIADEVLDAAPERGQLDILMDFAYPLPVIVIAELMGVPTEDRAQFKRWSDDIVATLGGASATPQLIERAAKSGGEIVDYFRDVIADRRRKPKEDLVTVLVEAADEGDVLSEPQLLATCVTMLIAGNETTRNLIANGMLALLRNPSELDRLWNDPSLVGIAVEELLRYAGPVQCTSRVATEDIEVGGKTIEKGQLVFTMLAAANRDPAHFEDPERLDIGRRDNHHVAFGFGVHACLGQPLARLEAQVAFATLARRIRSPALASDRLEWGPSFILRGLKSLPVTFGQNV